MRNYQLKIGDFIYPKETPVKIITLAVAAIILIMFTLYNVMVGLIFLLGMGLLFLDLYKMQMSTLGGCVRVGPNQFPEIYRLSQIAADRLDMDMPPVYIMQNPIMNAFATGFWGNYFVVLHSSIVDALTEEELLATIGHEFTHIKGNHVIITNLAAQGIGAGKLMWWLQIIIKYVFMYLLRCQEYTCDRGGLIACGSIQSVVTENAKFAIGKELYSRIDIMEFFKQALELDKKPFGILGELEASHPLTVKRIREAVRFYRSEKYQRIASMQGKMGTLTLQGSLATGDLMQKIVSKSKSSQAQGQQNYGKLQYSQPPYNYGFQGGFKQPQNPGNNDPAAPKQSSGFCKKCGTPRKTGARFCISCGTSYDNREKNGMPADIQENDFIPVIDEEGIIPVETIDNQMAADSEIKHGSFEKVCTKCGHKNNSESMFCTECGEKL